MARRPDPRSPATFRGACLSGGVALLVSQAVGCYPDPDDLRDRGGGSGGLSAGASGGLSGAAGGSAGTAGHGGTPGGIGGVGPLGAGGAGGSSGIGGHGVGGAGPPGVGGSGGSATGRCGGPACGGNLVGTWAIAFDCGTISMGGATCPAQVVDASGVRRSGMLVFTSAGTYTSVETDSGVFLVDTPFSCLPGVTCADLQTAYQGPGFVMPPAPTISSATCTTTATGCHCTLGALTTPQSDSGAYVVNGTQVTTISMTGTTGVNDYCSDAATLRLIHGTGTATNPDDTVFTKR